MNGSKGRQTARIALLWNDFMGQDSDINDSYMLNNLC